MSKSISQTAQKTPERDRFFLELKTELIREIMLSITLKLLVKLLYLYWIYK